MKKLKNIIILLTILLVIIIIAAVIIFNTRGNAQEEGENAENRIVETYWIPTLESNRVSDIFVILITEDRAIPYGVVAQKAMYQAQAKK